MLRSQRAVNREWHLRLQRHVVKEFTVCPGVREQPCTLSLKCNCSISTICQMAVKCVGQVPNSQTDLGVWRHSGHCLPYGSNHMWSVSENISISCCHRAVESVCWLKSGGLPYSRAHLFFVVLLLDKPGYGSLRRTGNTLQEGAVVLRPVHHLLFSHVKVFCWKRDRKCLREMKLNIKSMLNSQQIGLKHGIMIIIYLFL